MWKTLTKYNTPLKYLQNRKKSYWLKVSKYKIQRGCLCEDLCQVKFTRKLVIQCDIKVDKRHIITQDDTCTSWNMLLTSKMVRSFSKYHLLLSATGILWSVADTRCLELDSKHLDGTYQSSPIIFEVIVICFVM